MIGNPAEEITGVAGLEDSGPGDITFLLKASLLEKARQSGAKSILLKEHLPGLEKNQVIVPDPQMAFISLLEHFYVTPLQKSRGKEISPLAFISPEAKLDPDVGVHPFVCISAGARVGKGSVLYPGVFIGEGSEIGTDCTIYPNVCIREKVKIGNRVSVHAGSVIGADGFGYIFREGKHVKIPQVGGVLIEDDVEIGACTTIDRGTTGNTVVGKGTKIDNLVQIAHNVKIGQGAIIVSQSGIAGSSRIGNYVIIAAQSGIADHTEIEDGTIMGARAGVLPNDRIKKGAYAGTPIMPHRQWLKAMALLEKLPEMHKTISLLERKISDLERRLADDRD